MMPIPSVFTQKLPILSEKSIEDAKFLFVSETADMTKLIYHYNHLKGSHLKYVTKLCHKQGNCFPVSTLHRK